MRLLFAGQGTLGAGRRGVVRQLGWADRLPAARLTARVRRSLCALCERCIETCPYGARILDADNQKVVVNPGMCQGCGACAAVCPNDAAYVEGFGADRLMDVIDAALN